MVIMLDKGRVGWRQRKDSPTMYVCDYIPPDLIGEYWQKVGESKIARDPARYLSVITSDVRRYIITHGYITVTG